MIVGVKGRLEATGNGHVDINVGGVTLRVLVPASIVESAGPVSHEMQLHTHLMFQNEQPSLYGFATSADLSLFQMLITVSGIGPRTALALISSLPGQALLNAIASGDERSLSSVTGVGKRSAARIVVELQSKLGQISQQPVSVVASNGPAAVSALTALGYTAREASQAIASIDQSQDLPMEELVRLALQRLAQ